MSGPDLSHADAIFAHAAARAALASLAPHLTARDTVLHARVCGESITARSLDRARLLAEPTALRAALMRAIEGVHAACGDITPEDIIAIVTRDGGPTVGIVLPRTLTPPPRCAYVSSRDDAEIVAVNSGGGSA